MIHFGIICEMGPAESAGIVDRQSTKDFLEIRTLHVDGNRIIASDESKYGGETISDPCKLLERYSGV
jgi:hypothetical protein